MKSAKGALKVRCRINQSFHYHHQPKTRRVGVCQTVPMEDGKPLFPPKQMLVFSSWFWREPHLRHREIGFSFPNSTGSSQL